MLASPAEAKLNEKLDVAVTVDFNKTPLEDALSYVGALEGLKFQYDDEVDDGKKLRQEATLNVKDFPLRFLLKMLLEPVALDWVIRDEKIVITTREAAARQLRAWKYDVSDLAAAGIRAADLAAVTTAVVAPQAWQPAGGKGTLEIDGESITVRQTRQIHRFIYRLLDDVRQHASETEEETLEHNSRFLTKRYDVEDLLEPGATEEQFVRTITCGMCQWKWRESGGPKIAVLNGRTLEVSNEQWVHDRLSRLLESVGCLGLERGRNGSIFNRLEGNFQNALELAQDLIVAGDWPLLPPLLDGQTSAEFLQCPLLEAMQLFAWSRGYTVIVSDDAVGSNAKSVTLALKDVSFRTILDETLAPFKLDWYLDDPNRMVVAGPVTCAAHREVRVYRIKELVGSARDTEGLVKSLTETIEPESWKGLTATATIRVLPGLLVVSHNRRTHEKIAEFLASSKKRHAAP